MSPIGRMAHKTSRTHKVFTGVELAENDASWQRLSPVGVKAGERIRTADVQLGKLDSEHSNDLTEPDVTDSPSAVVPKSVPSEHENVSEPVNPHFDRLAVIADLLADLPQAERREVIDELPPSDRAAIARLLIARGR